MDTQANLIPIPIPIPVAVPAPVSTPVPAPVPYPLPEPRGFTTADILWALGIWSVIICLSPVIVFYMLMVA